MSTDTSLRHLPGFDPVVNALFSIFEDMMWGDPRCRYYILCGNCGTCAHYDHPPTIDDVRAYEHELTGKGLCPSGSAMEAWARTQSALRAGAVTTHSEGT